MRSSKQIRREAKALFRACLVNGLLDEGRARQVASALVQKKPRGYIGILGVFQRMIRLEQERRAALIETAKPMEPAARAETEAGLTRLYGPGLSFEFRESPALVGGMRIRVGSDVYDGSIRAKLTNLENNFSNL